MFSILLQWVTIVLQILYKKVTIKNIKILTYLSEYKFGKNKYVILNRFHESSKNSKIFEWGTMEENAAELVDFLETGTQ